MDTPQFFEILEGYANYRLEGEYTLPQAVDLVSRAIVHARENFVRHLLVDGTRTTGLGSPTTVEIYNLAVAFADAAKSAVKVALVVESRLIDPERFGTTVAQNRGMNVNVFTNEAEALAWLLSLPPGGVAQSKGNG